MSTSAADPVFWDHIATKYAAKPVGDAAAFERKKAITTDRLHPDARVIELGCGTGSLALDLAPYARHIDAIDFSPEMIRIANGKKAARGVANVTFHARSLSDGDAFDRGSFDHAWAFSILHLVDDRAATLRALFDLLKPGGLLVSSNLCLGDTWIPYGALISVMRWFGKAPPVHRYDRATLARELEVVGFVDVTEEDVGAERTIAFVLARKPD